MAFNIEKIRRSNNRKLKQYERFGIPIFLEALKQQATPTPSIIPMQNAYVEFYQQVFVDAAKTEWNRIRMQEKAFVPSDFFLNTWREWIRTWVIDNLYDLIDEVTATTLKKVEVVLADAINRGLNPTQTQELLVQEIGDVKRARAIARTESTRANNEGKKKSADDYARETGQVLYKVWIWGGSREPRIEHFELQNKPIRQDQKFVGINGLLMDKPGDRAGGAVNTVNCSCTVVYLSERLARRRFPDAFPSRPTTQAQIFPFRIANTLDEAKEISKNIINQNTPLKVNSTIFSNDLTLSQLNRYNQQIDKLTREYNLGPNFSEFKSEIDLIFKSNLSSYGYVESFGPKLTKVNFGHKYDSKSRLSERIIKNEGSIYRNYAAKSKVDLENVEISTLTHEFAHVISVKNDLTMAKYPQLKSFWDEIKKLRTAYRRELGKVRSNDEELNKIYLGDYANTNYNEFMAEGFTEYKLSSNPSKYAIEIGKLIDKYFKK